MCILIKHTADSGPTALGFISQNLPSSIKGKAGTYPAFAGDTCPCSRLIQRTGRTDSIRSDQKAFEKSPPSHARRHKRTDRPVRPERSFQSGLKIKLVDTVAVSHSTKRPSPVQPGKPVRRHPNAVKFLTRIDPS